MFKASPNLGRKTGCFRVLLKDHVPSLGGKRNQTVVLGKRDDIA